jgi:hypothetical protein
MQQYILFLGVASVIASLALASEVREASEVANQYRDGYLRALTEESSNIHFDAKPKKGSSEGPDTGPGMPGMPGKPAKVVTLPESLQNYPLTFTTGFARQDFYDLVKQQFVQASVTTLGVCAQFDPATARRFQPPSGAPSGIQAFKISSLVFKSSTAAELTYSYYTSTDCSGSAAATDVVAVPVTQTVTAANGLKLTAILSYVQQLNDAVRLIPSTISGFIGR